MPLSRHPFRQVDVFSAVPGRGNALAVVHDAENLTDEEMAEFARWTNLSETVFLSAPSDARADYLVRIWTTGGELPFAGHPTLGSAFAWLEAGGRPQREEVVVQECGVGLVEIRRGERLAFAAPPLRRSGAVDDEDAARIVRGLGVDPRAVLDLAWVDNGPGWIGVELDCAASVLALTPDPAQCVDLKVGVIARCDEADRARLGVDAVVRAFYADGRDFAEDPVTGSANAGLAQWLTGNGRLPSSYVAGQGHRLHRDGRIHVDTDGATLWIGGDVTTRIVGEVGLGRSG